MCFFLLNARNKMFFTMELCVSRFFKRHLIHNVTKHWKKKHFYDVQSIETLQVDWTLSGTFFPINQSNIGNHQRTYHGKWWNSSNNFISAKVGPKSGHIMSQNKNKLCSRHSLLHIFKTTKNYIKKPFRYQGLCWHSFWTMKEH